MDFENASYCGLSKGAAAVNTSLNFSEKLFEAAFSSREMSSAETS